MRVIMRGADLEASAVAPDIRSLAELLAERLDLARGPTRIEFEFEDGRLLRVHRHERIPATGLHRYDARER
jgi:hypothetical protein